jgi:hypothetical protein
MRDNEADDQHCMHLFSVANLRWVRIGSCEPCPPTPARHPQVQNSNKSRPCTAVACRCWWEAGRCQAAIESSRWEEKSLKGDDEVVGRERQEPGWVCSSVHALAVIGWHWTGTAALSASSSENNLSPFQEDCAVSGPGKEGATA